MDALRGALLRLRPPDVDELGLAAKPSKALLPDGTPAAAVVRVFNRAVRRIRGAAPDFAASLYRVAQEAITNAAKHAQRRGSRFVFACKRPPVRISARI